MSAPYYFLMVTHLFMFMTGDVTTVDEEHLVALVEARYADVSGCAGSDSGHDDGHALVTAALQTYTNMFQVCRRCTLLPWDR